MQCGEGVCGAIDDWCGVMMRLPKSLNSVVTLAVDAINVDRSTKMCELLVAEYYCMLHDMIEDRQGRIYLSS